MERASSGRYGLVFFGGPDLGAWLAFNGPSGSDTSSALSACYICTITTYACISPPPSIDPTLLSTHHTEETKCGGSRSGGRPLRSLGRGFGCHLRRDRCTPLPLLPAHTSFPALHHHPVNQHLQQNTTRQAGRGHPTAAAVAAAAAAAAAMANASMRAAAAQYINPAPKLSHQATVVRLYRQSLKTLGSWCVALAMALWGLGCVR